MKIGIIGFGFVGKAVYYGFCDKLNKDNILIKDRYVEVINAAKKLNVKTTINYDEICKHSDIIFVCVPTPTNVNTGEINLSIVDDVITSLLQYAYNGIVVIKSTVTPGTCRSFAEYFKMGGGHLNIVFNPEFLTEKNFINDFRNQTHIVLGGEIKSCMKVKRFYQRHGYSRPFFIVTWEEAEMTKYMMNCYLASKVALFNEFRKICKASNIDYNNIKTVVTYDSRIGPSHTNVPGDDGEFGFGGKCFPKDLLALINFAKTRQVDADILKQVWESNLKFRDNRDWLNIPGAIE